jgi:hypothetical protein
MNFEQFTVNIKKSIESRFVISVQDSINTEMMSLASDNLSNKQVFRFFRQQASGKAVPCFKTLLIASITSKEYLKDALKWAALSKDLLLDPETADIYLFIIWSGECKPSIEECLRIEASEDFCRKFVLRPNETEQSFVDRTFVTKLETPVPVDLGQDPLLSAFSGLEEQFTWFDDSEKNKWREAFNSGVSSFDLFYALIDHKSETNEAS